MNYVNSFNLLGLEARQRPCLTGNGEPTIESTIGDLYQDINTGVLYKYVLKNEVHKWEKVIEDAPTIAVSDNIIVIDDMSSVKQKLNVQLTSDTVTDFSSVKLFTADKNLINPQDVDENGLSNYFVTFEHNNDGTVTCTSKRTIQTVVTFYATVAPGTYTFSSPKQDEIDKWFMYTSTDNGETWGSAWIVDVSTNSVTRTFTEYYKLKFACYIPANSTITLQVQLEQGNTVTDFKPYNGSTYNSHSNGLIQDVDSISPYMMMYTDTANVIINTEYKTIDDTEKKIQQSIETITKYVDDSVNTIYNNIRSKSKVAGKKMAIIGDSISHGTGSVFLSDGSTTQTSGDNLLTAKNQAWWQLVKDRYGIADDVINNSAIGACYTLDGSVSNPRFSTYLNTTNLPSDLDIIMVFGGTNDWSQNRTLGNYEDAASTENNIAFYPAVKGVLEYLTLNFPETQIIFLTPIQRYTTDAKNSAMKEYVNAIKTLCADYGIPVCDIFSNSKMHMMHETFRATYCPDGTHPNAEGTKRYVENGIFPFLDQLWLYTEIPE